MSAPDAARLRQHLYRSLGPRAPLLHAVVQAARALQVRPWLVGGPVRDLLLGHPLRDLDVLVSDRAPEVARRCAAELGARLVVHAPFLTAHLEHEGQAVDLAQARRERYRQPGALPEVEPGSLAEDLARRDFSVHALALPLHRSAGTRLLDPEGGLADLAARRLRILHARSFLDDPTRLYRAARYGARLGFRLAPATRAAAREAVRTGAVDTLSASRLAHEIACLFDERERAPAARAAEALGLWRAVARGASLGAAAERGLRRLDRGVRARRWPEIERPEVQRAAAARLVAHDLRRPVLARALDRLGCSGRPRTALLDDLAAWPALRRALVRDPAPGRVDRLLQPLAPAVLLFLQSALPPAAARHVLRYARDDRSRPSPFDGHAARALGLRGPAVGAFLRAARERALDGKPVDARWQRRWLARLREVG